MTSVAFSPSLEHWIGLGLLLAGRSVSASGSGRSIRCAITTSKLKSVRNASSIRRGRDYVSSSRLTSVSSLGPIASRSANVGVAPGVFITERTDVLLLQHAGPQGRRGGAHRARAGGVRRPVASRAPLHRNRSGRLRVGWSVAMAGAWRGAKRPFELQLRSSLADVASVIDQSDGRTIIRISGPRARDTLSKGVHIDLHPSVFRPGDTAISIVSYIGVHFWQIEPAPTYEFAMFRSFAVSFWGWLVDAAAEFGVAVNDTSTQGSER